MAAQDLPEGHCRCCSRRSRSYRAARWLGPAYTIYRIMRDNWPW
ncbi:hypothetical protein ACH4S8_43275 [Streptomyces sp. NPDC021080]